MKKPFISLLGLIFVMSLVWVIALPAPGDAAITVSTTFNASEAIPPTTSYQSIVSERSVAYIDSAKSLKTLIAYGTSAINQRVQSLTALEKKVNSSKLAADNKASLTTAIDEQIHALQFLLDRIKSDTDLTVAKANVKSIYIDYRTYAVFIPKINLIMALNLQQNHITKLTGVFTKDQTAIDQQKDNCKDVAARQKALDDARALAALIQTKTNTALASISAMTPADYPINSKPVITAANTTLRDNRAQLLKIYALLKIPSLKAVKCAVGQKCSHGLCANSNQCAGTTACSAPRGCSSASPYYFWTCQYNTAGCPTPVEAACPTGQTCSNGQCQAAPCTNECTPGVALTCSATGSGVENCIQGNDGCYHKQVRLCADGQMCQGGVCVTRVTPCTEAPVECNVGETGCTDNHTRWNCLDMGCGRTKQNVACASGQTCSNGVCATPGTACTSTCNPANFINKCFSGNSASATSSWYTSCVKNNDGCYYWQDNPCSAGQVCSNAQCITSASQCAANGQYPSASGFNGQCCTGQIKITLDSANINDPYKTVCCATSECTDDGVCVGSGTQSLNMICREGNWVSTGATCAGSGQIAIYDANSIPRCCSGLIPGTDYQHEHYNYYSPTASSIYDNTCCAPSQCRKDGVCVDSGYVVPGTIDKCYNGRWTNSNPCAELLQNDSSPNTNGFCCAGLSPVWTNNYSQRACCPTGKCLAANGSCVVDQTIELTSSSFKCMGGRWYDILTSPYPAPCESSSCAATDTINIGFCYPHGYILKTYANNQVVSQLTCNEGQLVP
jgi:hypothetical protein